MGCVGLDNLGLLVLIHNVCHNDHHRTVLEYKYIVVDEASGEVHHWQPGDNLEVHIPAECMGTFVVKDDWVGSTRSIGVVDEPLPVVESAAQPAAEPASSRKDAEEAIAKADVCCVCRGGLSKWGAQPDFSMHTHRSVFLHTSKCCSTAIRAKSMAAARNL